MQRFLHLLAYIKKYRGNVVGNVISNILMVAFSVVSIPALIPFLNILFDQQPLVTELPQGKSGIEEIEQYINYYLSQVIIEHGKSQALAWMCVAIVVIYFFKNLFRYLSLFFMAPLRNGIVRDIRQQLFEKTMVLPLSYFSEARKGDIMSRITADVQEIEWSVLNVLESAVREPLLLIGAIAAMVIISPSLTLFVFVLLIFTGLVIGSVGKVLKRQSSKVQSQLGLLVSMIEEGLSGLRIIKAFNAEKFQTEKFAEANNDYRRLLNRLLWRRDMSSPLSEFLGVATVSVLIWYGYSEVLSGELTVATFLAFLYAFWMVIEPAKRFSSATYSIQKGMAAIERVEQILDANVRIEEPAQPKPIPTFQQAIEFRNVSFFYNNADTQALKNISLRIPKGKVVALVGSSGAGKSTIVDLLPRFYDVQEGGIFIDGENIKSFTLKDLRSQMGIVSQEAILFNDTIYNNIVFGLENVTLEEVIEAAKIANAHDFITATEHGYQTNIGDRGNKLSGGQRQRLTIARAILRNPPILILDEATSALDSESERLVQEALIRVMQNRTAIVVAHRLSTIQHADEIVVLRNGQIIEQGSHLELMEQDGEYRKLVALQAV